MPMPFEAIIPFVMITAMFGVTSGGYKFMMDRRNEGKTPRTNLDDWERALMDRDLRLTGTARGQTDNPVAPEAFKTNSFYRIYNRI
ncbi:hypothetical protein BB561_005083 [Smittium simulii]|uniref:NADH dehydrogenase [ubiquinone] 1 alpha subcomplex subunit 1 n=1 Tax=Smittium simulii TaxID=133385 RepID=A0A2T9YCF2_9FUNG|nr:hypothetical protein BB561_005083 [Smittium simulii]